MEVLLTSLEQVWETFQAIWPYLLVSVLLSAAMRRYINAERINHWLQKYHRTSIVATTGVAISTPLCSCGGGIAVALSMMAASIPWGPLVAFIIASPLTSPDEVFYSAGLFGWPFALTYLAAAASAGIVGGFLAHALASKGWLTNQARYKSPPSNCCSTEEDQCCPAEEDAVLASHARRRNLKGARYAREVWLVGRRLLLTFIAASFLGYFFSNLIPVRWISLLFGSGQRWSVPLGATLGLPLYLNISSSLPIARAFLAHGATPGTAMAFLLVGAGTSIGALAGLLTIARWRIVILVIITLWPVAILFGYLYDALMAMKLF